MNEIKRSLDAMTRGDARVADQLLPLVYEELRKLASARMAHEPADHTLQPTALVHEAYLRLVNVNREQEWDGRGHFFAAAAEAMRRILVENARRKQRLRHGGSQERVDLAEVDVAAPADDEKILLVNDALEALAKEDPLQARVVSLRFFAGLSHQEIAEALGVSEKTAQRYWIHAKVWLYERIRAEAEQ